MIPTHLEMMMTSPKMDMSVPSALEQMLKDRRRMQIIRQKYNLKDGKEQRIPMMQWQGDNNG